MTQEDQHSLIGRLYSEKQNLTRELGLAKARAFEIGMELTSLGSQLQSRPEAVQFEYQSPDTRFCPPSSTKVFTLKAVDVPKMIELTDEIRNKTIRLMEIEKQLP